MIYQDKFDSLDERVKRLEKGGNLTDVSGIERRLQILEEKCKNIIIDEDTRTVPNESMTSEERLQILEQMTETETSITKFDGDISFNDGEKDILASDLATVDEVNTALGAYVTSDKIDTYEKMWMNTEPAEPLYLNPNFVYKDEHIMSSKAVRKLIDNNIKTSVDLSDYMTKTNETTLTLDNGDETVDRKLVIHPVSKNQFSISLYTPEEKRMISFVVGAVDFGYNQVRLQNLMINERSIQSVIKSDDDSNTVIATDTSIYTTATVDKIINELTLSFNSKIAAREARIAKLEG